MSTNGEEYPQPSLGSFTVANRQDENGNWRAVVVRSRTKFNEHTKGIFLREYAKHGIMGKAAKASGVTSQTVHNHLKSDEEFAEACLAAQDEYQAKFLDHFQDLVFNGVEKRTYDRMGNLVSEETQYPIRLIEMEAKKVDKSYTDKREVDVTVSGGVLVAPADVGSIEDWEAKFASQKTPSGQGAIIEGEAEVVED